MEKATQGYIFGWITRLLPLLFMEFPKPKTSWKTSCFFLNDAIFWRCFWKNINVDVFDDVLQNSKHRANDASNDVNRPPLGGRGGSTEISNSVNIIFGWPLTQTNLNWFCWIISWFNFELEERYFHPCHCSVKCRVRPFLPASLCLPIRKIRGKSGPYAC